MELNCHGIELPDGSYSVEDIQNHFGYNLKNMEKNY